MIDQLSLPIDIPTLAFSRGLIQMVLAGLIVYVGSQQDDRHATRWWAWGLLLNGLALLAFALRVPPAWEPAITVGNHLGLAASAACLLIGFWRFGGRPVQPLVLLWVLGAPLLSLLLFEWGWPNGRARILVTAAGQWLYLLVLQDTLRQPPRAELARIYRRLHLIVVLYALLFLWSYASLVEVLPTTARVPADYHRSLFSLASLLYMLCLAVACLALQFTLQAARHADFAEQDWLTELLNRRGFFQAVAREEALRVRHERSDAVIVVDIDHFKAINDRYGHAAGDEVLRALARQLRRGVRADDLVARLGGEEFALLLPGDGIEAASRLAERIRDACAESSLAAAEGSLLRYTISAGVAEALPGETLAAALVRADQALYRAKREGRNRVVRASVEPAPIRRAAEADRV